MAHHAQIVSDEDVGQVQLLLNFHHQTDHLGLDRYIQGRDNLVADDELWGQGQGPGDGDALALSAGKLMGIAVSKLGVETY